MGEAEARDFIDWFEAAYATTDSDRERYEIAKRVVADRCPRCRGTRLVPLPQGMSSGFYAFMAPGCRTNDGLQMNCPRCTRVTNNVGEMSAAALEAGAAEEVVPLRAGEEESNG